MILVKSAGVFMHELLPLLWDGTLVTLQITVFGSLLAVVVALVAALGKLSRWPGVKWLAIGFIELFRGTSLLVQLFWLFYVLPLPPFSSPGAPVSPRFCPQSSCLPGAPISWVPPSRSAVRPSFYPPSYRTLYPRRLLFFVQPSFFSSFFRNFWACSFSNRPQVISPSVQTPRTSQDGPACSNSTGATWRTCSNIFHAN